MIPTPAPDSVFGTPQQTGSLAAAPPGMVAEPIAPPDPYANDVHLLSIFDRCKREAMDQRWVFEREWLRDLYYVNNRQWISYHPTRREWVDKRLQKWIPRPTTNKMGEIVQSIRTNLGAINLSIKARPLGNDTTSIAAAEVADQISPILHEEHDMNQVMRESDFWQIVNGNACLQISWDKDSRFNKTFVPFEQCMQCGTVSSPKDIKAASDMCPACGGNQFQPATDPMTGEPAGEYVSFGKGKTTALSPFEYAFPPNITRWDELPYIIRLRWREKAWFEANMPDIAPKITYEKTPQDRSLQLYKSLAVTNDVGSTTGPASFASGASTTVEGTTEYELWLRPTPEFPQGLVLRVIGDKAPVVLRLPEEGLPGPFPYKDIKGNVLFPFFHAQYEHVGGRLWGKSALSPLIQKQDQLNQLDSLIQLIVQRMANPIWVVPEGAGIEHFTGEPGLVMKWNPLSSGGQAKPERIPGSEVPSSLQQLRAEIIKDIEELSGAFDIIKGQKPTGIEAFSALQLLVERSQSRFTSVFQARGEMYRRWATAALELERQYGPNERVLAIIGPNRGYTFKHFQRAQLNGQVNLVIEDGSNMPKTALGKRAAIEQANQMLLLDPVDPDQKYALLTHFGLSDLVPTLNVHVQSALQVQDEFENWINNPIGPSPLVVKAWFDAEIHWVERIKWLNGDKMKELIATNPMVEPLIMQHLAELQFIMTPPVQMDANGQPMAPEAPGAPKPQGSGMAMKNSRQNSQPKGNSQSGPNVGPS